MNIFVSNKLEILARRLADELDEPPVSPLAGETIVVQSAGMQKWLSLELARYHGICANYDFPFPNAFIDDVFKAFISDYQPDLSYSVEVLTWKIMEILPQLSLEANFQPVHHYLGNNYDQLKLFQLAGKIAATFDQYLIFRPEMILAWEEGRIQSSPEKWQAQLWQKITASQGRMHKARLKQLFLSTKNNKLQRKDALPERISIFGISYLPPYHLEIFYGLSRHIPVNLFYLNPSQEFWADIKSNHEIGLALRKAPQELEEIDQELFHLEKGNSLLATMGAVGRDFFRLIGSAPTQNIDIFEPPPETDLLSTIQADIYYLRDRGQHDPERKKITSDDESIQIHSCHNKLREVEVLHDVLLFLLEKNKQILPKDILVMTPMIEVYAPYIEAVMEAREPKIPYSIADRDYLADSIIFRGLFSLLTLVESRFTAEGVLSLLENPAIRAKFAITGLGLELIRHWVEKTNIKWGIDLAHKLEFDLPEFTQNTWKAGLERLILGYAMTNTDGQFYGDTLPYGEIEGDQTEILGRFLDFWERLRQTKNLLSDRKTLENWSITLKKIMDDFFTAAGDYREEIYALRSLLDKIIQEQNAAQLKVTTELSVIKTYLQQNFAQLHHGSKFLTGGVTFCAMLPMRSIPFPVICLMGMDNEAYPRQDRKIGFDLMELKKKAGDRSLRKEDQYLFLEAILSARKNLIISYIGQDAKDNSTILPSVLVSELLDYVDQGFYGEKGDKASGQLIRKHYLHGFSPAYFKEEGRLFSYSQENFQAARVISTKPADSLIFAAEKLNVLSRKNTVINIKELILFYRNPAKYFLEKSLCLKFGRDEIAEEDAEPFAINSLVAYQIKQELMEKRLLGVDSCPLLAVKRAEGVLPVGLAGDYYYESLKNRTREFVQKIEPYLSGQKLADLPVDITIAGQHLVGVIDNLYTQNYIHYRPAKLKHQDYIKTWLNHLLINIIPTPQYPRVSILLGEDKSCKLNSVENARPVLEILIEHYLAGLSQPLKYFPRTSWRYAEALLQKKYSREAALIAARTEWSGDSGGRIDGEAEEVPQKICFAGWEPLDAEFERIAISLLGELFSHLEKLEK